jgi:organic hydroperoxide reductase OsmC/OhrA
MLWYLHLCAVNGVIVLEYKDEAIGTMEENPDGSGQFSEVTLRPKVTVSEKSMEEKATTLHHDANKMCFIARSVKFPVHHNPLSITKDTINA